MTRPDPMQAIIGADLDMPEVECPVAGDGWACWRTHVLGDTLVEIRDKVAAHLAEAHPTVIEAEPA